MKNLISVGDQRVSDADWAISVGDWVISDADLVLKLYYSYFYIETKGTFLPLKGIIILYPKGFKNQVVARVARDFGPLPHYFNENQSVNRLLQEWQENLVCIEFSIKFHFILFINYFA